MPSPLQDVSTWLWAYADLMDDALEPPPYLSRGEPVTYTPYVPEVDDRYVSTRSVDLPAPVERVWRAVSDAGEIARWFPNRSATLDLRARWHRAVHLGRPRPFPIVVEALDEPHYLAWSWGHEPTQSATTLVEWRLAETANGDPPDRHGVGRSGRRRTSRRTPRAGTAAQLARLSACPLTGGFARTS